MRTRRKALSVPLMDVWKGRFPGLCEHVCSQGQDENLQGRNPEAPMENIIPDVPRGPREEPERAIFGMLIAYSC